MDQFKSLALNRIEEKSSLIADTADAVWSFAETSLKEEKSCAFYVEKCKQEGFTVEENFCGIPTAFAASFGSGSPRIGILAEYDALSGLSQAKEELVPLQLINGGNGHGCGHHILGAGAFGAALGIKAYLEDHPGQGTVILYGCPGEEGWASKAYMAREKVWESLDAALTWHPDDCNEVSTGGSNSCLQYLYKFSGVASHASGSPEMGRSALDAVELMNIGVQFLREHMSSKARIHYAIIDAGGSSPNVVQPRASVLYYIREHHIKDAMALLKRVDKIAEGAAIMTETTMEKFFIDGLADTITNHVLETVMHRNFSEQGASVYTPEEIAFTDALSLTYPGSDQTPGLGSSVDDNYALLAAQMRQEAGHAMNDFLLPQYTGTVFRPGSTDVGDVSWLCPTAQIHVAAWPNGEPGHSWQHVSCSAGSIGHKAAIKAASVIAASAIDLFENPEILKEARDEFKLRTASGYICPFPPEAKPEINL